MTVSRRTLALQLAAIAGAATTSRFTGAGPHVATARAQDDLGQASLRLNWAITGPHAPYYLGVERGFYQEEGIELALNEGNGSGTTAQLVSNKSDTFGLADAAAVLPLIAQGLEIRCVGMVSPRTTLAVIARQDSGITRLQDLEGKTVAVTPGDALTQLWPAVVAANNLDASSIRLVNVDAAAKVPAVLERRADALLGSAADQPFLMEAEGVPAVAIEFADHGVNVLNLGIWVHPDTIAEQPDLIRAFLAATRRSFMAAEENPEETVALLTAAKPELDPTVAMNQFRVYMTQLESPKGPEAGFLYNCPEDWTQTVEIMKQYAGLETDMTAENFYTNDFVPEGADATPIAG